MQDRLSFGAIANSSVSCGGAWCSSRNIPIRLLTSSSDSSFGFSLQISLRIWCSFCILPVCLLGFSFSVQYKNRGDNKKVDFPCIFFPSYPFGQNLESKKTQQLEPGSRNVHASLLVELVDNMLNISAAEPTEGLLNFIFSFLYSS